MRLRRLLLFLGELVLGGLVGVLAAGWRCRAGLGCLEGLTGGGCVEFGVVWLWIVRGSVGAGLCRC